MIACLHIQVSSAMFPLRFAREAANGTIAGEFATKMKDARTEELLREYQREKQSKDDNASSSACGDDARSKVAKTVHGDENRNRNSGNQLTPRQRPEAGKGKRRDGGGGGGGGEGGQKKALAGRRKGANDGRKEQQGSIVIQRSETKAKSPARTRAIKANTALASTRVKKEARRKGAKKAKARESKSKQAETIVIPVGGRLKVKMVLAPHWNECVTQKMKVDNKGKITIATGTATAPAIHGDQSGSDNAGDREGKDDDCVRARSEERHSESHGHGHISTTKDEESASAVMIQRVYRGRQGRLQMKEKRRQRKKKEEKENASAIKIQKVYRGRQGRKRVRERRKKRQEEKQRISSAVRIQKVYRGSRSRKRLKEMQRRKDVTERKRKGKVTTENRKERTRKDHDKERQEMKERPAKRASQSSTRKVQVESTSDGMRAGAKINKSKRKSVLRKTNHQVSNRDQRKDGDVHANKQTLATRKSGIRQGGRSTKKAAGNGKKKKERNAGGDEEGGFEC